MTTHRNTSSQTVYRVWLRRGDPSNPRPAGSYHKVRLTEIGIAAAHETLVTATAHMAAIWTDLFKSMIVPGRDLRWAGRGPGVGRDARIAYSSLLGRYMARAYLAGHQGVWVLVPLDEAKRRLKGSRFSIEKDPRGPGLQADWIGLDHYGLVIAEAKGTYDPNRIKAWHGPGSVPPRLRTAIEQAARTVVFAQRSRGRRKLPTKRWAIASRWGTADKPKLKPTLLAWDHGKNRLDTEDYQELSEVLVRADVDGIMRGLGHEDIAGTHTAQQPPRYAKRRHGIQVGDLRIEPGFAAFLGPFGVHPLRNQNDFLLVRHALRLDMPVAIASLSERYVTNVIEGGGQSNVERYWKHREWVAPEDDARERDADIPFAVQTGLTVAWPRGGRTAVEVEWD